MNPYSTREAWLLAAVGELRGLFLSKGHVVPQSILVSCGFASTGKRSHHIGECWSTSASEVEINQIYISPTLGDPVAVLDTLVHELVHAVDDCKNKHGKPFRKIALSVGLQGSMRSASAGPTLKGQLAELAQKLGPYPHSMLKVQHRKVVRQPRPRARCGSCGFEVPMLRKFLEYGPPICPRDRVEMEEVGEWA